MNNCKNFIAKDGTPYTCYYNSKGQLHNVNGPAVIFDDGYVEYWIDGVMITESQFKAQAVIVLDYSSAVVDNGESVTF